MGILNLFKSSEKDAKKDNDLKKKKSSTTKKVVEKKSASKSSKSMTRTTEAKSVKGKATVKSAEKKTTSKTATKQGEAKSSARKTVTKNSSAGKKSSQLKKSDEKICLIVDSDVSNEIDDQFALSYVLSRQDIFDLQAVTIAPFRVTWQKNLNVRAGMIDSKNEAERILRLFGIKYSAKNPLVYYGCDDYLSNGYNEKNPAVDTIIKLAKKNDSVTICCIGTLTNVAMAIRIAPKIASKLKVVWLGTDNVMLDHFEDTNYSKDIVAFNEVIASEVDLTVFPTYLARSFVTSLYEFERNAKSNSITRYLISLINKFQFTEENMGIKTIYDIGPVAYLIHPEQFKSKVISPQILIKDGKVKLPEDRKINYITAVPKHQFVWTDFLSALNSNDEHFAKSYYFFTSDTHFGDEGKVRRHLVPFKTVEEMNNELVRRWNNRVAPNDTVYHLGDFGDYEFVKKLNGRIILICGNYEEADFRKDFDKFRQKLLDLGFADVIKDGLYLDKEILGEKVYLTHKPSNRAKDCKTIFGHVHTLSLVKSFGFNVCTTYHYFSPVGIGTAKRYLQFVGTDNMDEDASMD